MTELLSEKLQQDIDLSTHNQQLADLFALIASYYNMSGDQYRAKAFTTAANNIGKYPIAILSGEQATKELPGIGPSSRDIIDEYLTTGKSTRLEELENMFLDRKQTIDYFRSFYGIGPITAVKFYNQGFRTLEDIWYKGNLNEGQKLGIIWREHINLRIPREEMDLISNKISSLLNPYNIKWTIAGSYRRGELSSGDIDVLVQAREDINMDSIVSLLKPIIPATLANGASMFRGIVRIDEQHNGHRIDIRLIHPQAYIYALLYFTGSQRFNILMRQRAIQFGLTLNEYGLYDNQGRTQLVDKEEDVFTILRVKYMTPEERTKDLSSLSFI